MFRYKLQQFMYGRNGADELSFASIVAAVVLSVISMFFGWVYWLYIVFRLLTLALIVYAFFRMFSRNVEKRRSENVRFTAFIDKMRSKRRNNQNTNSAYSSYGYNYDYNTKKAQKVKYKEDKKLYKYFKCPSCRTKLRVPKGKGKLTITCPKCRNTFKGKS